MFKSQLIRLKICPKIIYDISAPRDCRKTKLTRRIGPYVNSMGCKFGALVRT